MVETCERRRKAAVSTTKLGTVRKSLKLRNPSESCDQQRKDNTPSKVETSKTSRKASTSRTVAKSHTKQPPQAATSQQDAERRNAANRGEQPNREHKHSVNNCKKQRHVKLSPKFRNMATIVACEEQQTSQTAAKSRIVAKASTW